MTFPPRPATRRNALREALTGNLPLKALALILAILLWLVVGARRPTEGFVTVRVEPTLDSSLVLLDGPPQVRVLVSGPAADLVKLYTEPPVVRRAVAGDAPDSLMLDVGPDDVHIPAELRGSVRVLNVEPRAVLLRFETRATRLVNVVNDGRVVVQGDARRVRFEPATVRITGPRGAVRHLRALHPVALTIAAGDSLAHLAPLDTTGTGVRAHPALVRVLATPAGGR